MSADDSREVRPGSRDWEKSQQSVHWREIGISAVAAAARYSKESKPAAGSATGGAKDGDAKIVTLRDLEFLAV